MTVPSPPLTHLSDTERAELESWLLEFDLRWSADRLRARAGELPPTGPLRLSALTEMVKIDLDRQWQRGQRVRVEQYLEAFPELDTANGPALELIGAEVDVRTQFGDRPDPTELFARFPAYGDSLHRLLGPTVTVVPDHVRTPAPADRADTPSDSDLAARELPAEFGRYRILQRLGHGGMGTVYLAEDTQLDRRIALKVPHFARAGDRGARERFRREGRAAAALDHPHLCRVYDVGEHDGIPYLTMAFVEGRPLCDPADTPLPAERVAEVIRKVALALGYAHDRGVVHRDLKPSNILIDTVGEPVVTDFGLARREGAGDPQLSRDGVPLGTPAYMSPEQVVGKSDAIGPASDIFSLGVILYQLLAGRLPYHGGAAEVMVQVVTEPAPPPSSFRAGIDPRLEAACRTAMAKDPADRFASMEEFAAALGHEPRIASSRWRVRALAGAAVLVVATGVIVSNRWPWSEEGGPPAVPPDNKPGARASAPLPMAPPPRFAKSAPTIFHGPAKAVTAVAFAADGNNVLSADDQIVRRWEPVTGAEVGSGWAPRGESCSRLVLASDGRRVLSHFSSSSIDLHDTGTKKPLLTYSDPGNPHTGMLALSANGTRVVTAKESVGGDAFVAVWDLDSNKTYRFTGHPKRETIQLVALSADGTRGASAGKDGIRVWDVESVTEQRYWEGRTATALALTADGKFVLTGNALGALVLRDPDSGKEVGRFEGHTGAITAITVSPDGALLLTGSDDGTARVWSMKTRAHLQKLEGHSGPVRSVALSLDGTRALTGGNDGTVRLWSLSGAAPEAKEPK